MTKILLYVVLRVLENESIASDFGTNEVSCLIVSKEGESTVAAESDKETDISVLENCYK